MKVLKVKLYSVRKFETGMLKFYAAFDTSNFDLIQDDINDPEGARFSLNNRNFYTNTSYQGILGNNWSIQVRFKLYHC